MFKCETKNLDSAEEAGIDPDGANAESGPSKSNSSGFGGLGLEGMVGMDDPVEVGTLPPGEGKSGAMSGDISWKGGRDGGEFVKNDGVVEIVLEASELRLGDKESEGETMKAMMMLMSTPK